MEFLIGMQERICTESVHFWAPGDPGAFKLDVVSGPCHHDALQFIEQNTDGGDAQVLCVALLVPDDVDRDDASAVKVLIYGLHVGQLSRNDALAFRRRLAASQIEGLPTSCQALIDYGAVDCGEHFQGNVRLDLPPLD